jgi:lambda family phage portal protein
MGIEYQQGTWGIGKPVAYHFIKRQPNDWQWSRGGGITYVAGSTHDRVPAEEISHYARAVDADGTRPAPWVSSTITSSRQRDQAMIAETIAWRAAACKTGWLESNVVAEGGFVGDKLPDPSSIRGITTEPGGIIGLPYGVTYKDSDPRHPNANVEEFRKASLRDGCAGMPGANYSTMANDYEAINFSAGRLQRLDTNETNMLLQEFDIAYAEQPIFEAWLEMALTTGAIPLPLAKLDKFNNKTFTGRRWQGVDDVKENTADALAVANKFTSRTRVCAGRGRDFEEVLFELAEEEMLISSFGLKTETTAENPTPAAQEDDDDEAEEEPEEEPKAPAKKPRAKKSKSRLTI